MKSNKQVSLFFHILPSFVLVVILSICSYYYLAEKIIGRYQHDIIKTTLIEQAQIISSVLDVTSDSLIDDIFDRLSKNTYVRYTIIDSAGNVLADNNHDPSTMENHIHRPEVEMARRNGMGESTRFSETIRKNLMYVAIKKGGMYIRVSIPIEQISILQNRYTNDLIKFMVILVVIAIILSLLLAKNISRPFEILKGRAIGWIEGEDISSIPISGPSEVIELYSILEQNTKVLKERYLTIRKQKEHLHKMLSAMSEGVVVIDKNDLISIVNKAILDVFNVSYSEEDAVGKHIYEIVRNSEFQHYISELKNDGLKLKKKLKLLDRHGIEKILLFNGVHVEIEDSYLIVIHDVTESYKFENLRKNFVSNVSHELRTPLTAIKGFAETLLDGALDDKKSAKKFIGIIDTQAVRLNNLIEDLLSIARLEKIEETENFELKKASILSVVERSVELCVPLSLKRDVTVEVVEKRDTYAMINPERLEEAIINLLDNAIKFSGQGGHVRVFVVTNKDNVEISVEDTGLGISKEHHERIFERFYRVDKARSRELGGTGLGLSIVKHIVQAHGGDLRLDSEIGKGSKFTIILKKVV